MNENEICMVEVIKLAGYISGVKITMDKKSAEVLEKSGAIKILDVKSETNKIAPEVSKKKLGLGGK